MRFGDISSFLRVLFHPNNTQHAKVYHITKKQCKKAVIIIRTSLLQRKKRFASVQKKKEEEERSRQVFDMASPSSLAEEEVNFFGGEMRLLVIAATS